MKQSWFTQSPTLFPFINMELLKDIGKISTQHKPTVLKFAKQYELQYIGEIAERWNQRDLVKEPKDLTTLALGFSFCYAGNFLYDQKEMFVKNAYRYLKESWDPTIAVTVLYFASVHRIMQDDIQEIEELTKMLFEHSWNKEEGEERAYVISLMTYIYYVEKKKSYFNADAWRVFVCNLIDGLNIKFSNPHEDYPIMLLLSEIYTDLEKPKAKEFKTKGIVRYLQSLHALRTKEIDPYKANGMDAVLGVKRDDIHAYNYILAMEHYDNVEQNITEPGSERITQNYLRTQFLSEQPLSEGFIQRLERNAFSYKFLLGSLNEFKNVENLKTFVIYANKILSDNVNPSFISLIKLEVVDELMIKNIVHSLLKEPYRTSYYSETLGYKKLSEEDFLFLEGLKDKLGLELVPTQAYVNTAIEYGVLAIEDVETLKSKKVVNEAIQYLYSKKTLPEVLDFLGKIPVTEHKILISSYNSFNEKLEGETKKKFFEMYLEALFTLEPKKYPKQLCEFFRMDSFVEMFELTESDIEHVEKTLFKNDLLTKHDAEDLYRKYTPKEVLEKERIEKIAKELLTGSSSTYTFRSDIRRHLADIKQHPSLQQAVYQRMVNIKPKDEYDLKEYLVLFYKLKAKGILNDTESSSIEEKGLQYAKAASL